MAVPVTRCQRSPVTFPDGTIFFLRGKGVGRLQDGKVTTIGGAFAGNTCLLDNPDASVWAFDNGGDPDRCASLTRIGAQLGEQIRHEVDYPPARRSLTAGNSVTLAETNTRTWDSHEIAGLVVSPSVSELAQSPDGSVYLASYYPTPEQGLTSALIRIALPSPSR